VYHTLTARHTHTLQTLKASGSSVFPQAALLTNGHTTGNQWPAGQGTGAAQPPMKPHGGQGCSIYIKGMPEDADKLWLYEKFSRFGGILSVRILLDEHTGRCNGIGYVNFTDPEGARDAHETMNGVNMGERLLHVMVQNHGGSVVRNRQQPGQTASQLDFGPGIVPITPAGVQGTGLYLPPGPSLTVSSNENDFPGNVAPQLW